MKDKLVIYQVLPRLFGADAKDCQKNGSKTQNGCGKLADFSIKALDELREMGINYIWYTGVISHATKTTYAKQGIPNDNPDLVKGNAGSPYAIKNYYDIDPDLAENVSKRVDEFKRLIKRSHHCGLKTIMDFIPNHVAAEYKGDNFTDANYYEGHIHDGDWTDTAKLNYNNHDTWEKMLDILNYWADMGIDGFRCDMAELVPCEFWEWAIPQIKKSHKGLIFIAEVYNPQQYRDYIFRGHFDYLYDKVGLYDSLKAVVQGQSASILTNCWQAVDDIKDHMVNFLENHDEQRIASRFFAGDAKKGRPALLVSALMGTNPFMLYFGQELGEAAKDSEGFSGDDGRTTIYDYWTLGSISRWRNQGKFDSKLLSLAEKDLRNYYIQVLRICNTEKAIREGLFFDLMYANYDNTEMDTNKVYAFIRKKDKEMIIVLSNFSDTTQNIHLNIPDHAYEYLNIPHIGPIAYTNLLTGMKDDCYLIPKQNIPFTIPANNGLVLKFNL